MQRMQEKVVLDKSVAGGNININCDSLNANLLLLAPNGKITINGRTINVTGKIVAKEIEVNCESFACQPEEMTENFWKIGQKFQSDYYGTVSLINVNDEYKLNAFSLESIYEYDIYTRKSGENAFSFKEKVATLEDFIIDEEFTDALDILVNGKTFAEKEVRKLPLKLKLIVVGWTVRKVPEGINIGLPIMDG